MENKLNELKHDHHRSANPTGGKAQHDHRYYWKGAHRDWRIWVYVILMLAAMLLFVMRRNVGWRVHVQPQRPPSGTVGK